MSIESFKKKYEREISKLGLRVEYLGSTKETHRWKRGKSDLDIIVYGNNISLDIKVYGILLIRDLNYEEDLGLEDVPFYHWTPIYVDSPYKYKLREIAEEGLIRQFTESIRAVTKRTTKEWWPFKYRDWWNCVEFAYNHRDGIAFLPRPCIPVPAQVLLRLL